MYRRELVLQTAPLILFRVEPTLFTRYRTITTLLHCMKTSNSLQSPPLDVISPPKLDSFPQNRTSNSPSTTLVIVNIAIMFPLVMQLSLGVINARDFQLSVAAGGVMSIYVPIMTLQGICTGSRFNTGRQKWMVLLTISFPVIAPHFSLKALQLRVFGWWAMTSTLDVQNFVLNMCQCVNMCVRFVCDCELSLAHRANGLCACRVLHCALWTSSYSFQQICFPAMTKAQDQVALLLRHACTHTPKSCFLILSEQARRTCSVTSAMT